MAKLLKLRRGTTSQHGSFTGAEGEVTVDTDKEALVVHNGSTAGGFPAARENMSNVSSASIAGRLATDSIATTKIAAGALPTDVTVASANIVNGTIVTADIAADQITSALIADDQIDSEHIVADSIDSEHYAPNSVDADALAHTSVTAGSYGSATAIPAITIDAQGRITAASTNTVNTTTNLGANYSTTTVTVVSSTGDNIALQEANGSAAGVMSRDHHDKLDGIENSATADQTDAEIRAAVEAASDSNVFTDADHSKLNGIASSANNYSHPTHPGDDFSIDTGHLSGATVIDDIDINVTTDGSGHVTDCNGTVATRNITLGDLGYTGATNANYITNNNQLTNGAGYITSANGGNAATLDSIDSSQFVRSDTADTITATLTARQIQPQSNNSYNLGTSSYRWANLYVNDAHFSNEGHSNSVDGTWGNWTLQEGESDIFMLNNRSGKKYKINLTEVV